MNKSGSKLQFSGDICARITVSNLNKYKLFLVGRTLRIELTYITWNLLDCPWVDFYRCYWSWRNYCFSGHTWISHEFVRITVDTTTGFVQSNMPFRSILWSLSLFSKRFDFIIRFSWILSDMNCLLIIWCLHALLLW